MYCLIARNCQSIAVCCSYSVMQCVAEFCSVYCHTASYCLTHTLCLSVSLPLRPEIAVLVLALCGTLVTKPMLYFCDNQAPLHTPLLPPSPSPSHFPSLFPSLSLSVNRPGAAPNNSNCFRFEPSRFSPLSSVQRSRDELGSRKLVDLIRE